MRGDLGEMAAKYKAILWIKSLEQKKYSGKTDAIWIIISIIIYYMYYHNI